MKQSFQNEKLTAIVEDGIVISLKDPRDASASEFLFEGNMTGSAVYTKPGDSSPKGRKPEHFSAREPLQTLHSECTILPHGLCLHIETEDDVSEFGMLLELDMLSHTKNYFMHQFLPSSPYASEDGKYQYCIFSSPDGRYLSAAAITHCDGWKINYNENAHFIDSFSFLASFDEYYKKPPVKAITVVLCPAQTLEEAYENISKAYGKSYIRPVIAGNFGGNVTLCVSDGVSHVNVKEENLPSYEIPVENGMVQFALKDFGKAEVTPYANGAAGIPAVVWNGVNADMCMDKTMHRWQTVYCNDFNLCEAGCWTWAMARYLQTHNDEYIKSLVTDDLKTIMAKRQPFEPRRTIVPYPMDGKPAYHMYTDDRAQEAMFGVSILLDLYRALGDKEIVEYAVNTLDANLASHLQDDGTFRLFNGHDYTTVCCLVIPVVDMALFFKDIDPERSEHYRKAAISMADHVVHRGKVFPTEGESAEKHEVEDGSVSCSALTALYVYKNLSQNPEYITFAEDILKTHNAWRMNSPDVRLLGSTMRWWEIIWEGDGNGPGICAGHAWTIWRAEALFLLGIIKKNKELLLDSWNAFMTNMSKTDKNGDMYSCYVPDFICGGGIDSIREHDLLTWPLIQPQDRYKLVHDYPVVKDYSLARYVWVRWYDTWKENALVTESVAVRCKIEGNRIIPEKNVTTIYVERSIIDKYTCDAAIVPVD